MFFAFAVCWLLIVVCSLLFVGCWLLGVVNGSLCHVCCVLLLVCCSLRDVCFYWLFCVVVVYCFLLSCLQCYLLLLVTNGLHPLLVVRRL